MEKILKDIMFTIIGAVIILMLFGAVMVIMKLSMKVFLAAMLIGMSYMIGQMIKVSDLNKENKN